MLRQVAAIALVVLGATACASRQSSQGGPSVGHSQPATIVEAIGGRKYTGYVRLGYGEDGRLLITSSTGVFVLICNKAMAEWNAGDRLGRAPCATVTLELDGEPANFYVASGWTMRPLVEKSAEQLRLGSGFIPGVGGAVTSQTVQSPVMSSMLWAMYGGLFEFAGAPTLEGCEALRPRETKTLIDGRCQPARLDIY